MILKRIYAVVLVLLLVTANGVCAFAAGSDAPLPDEESIPASSDDGEALAASADVHLELPCKAAILLSTDTGDILYEMQADDELPMASITKVMTLLLTFEALDAGKVHMEDIVPVSEHAFSMGGSQIWLEPGEQFTLDEMLKAICVSSANDAAVAVAELIGGSETAFVEMMNARAKELGMLHTQFKNACGLDEDAHYSSARDIAIMSRELMKHSKVFEYTGIWTDTLRGGETELTNTNKLLRSYQGITGLKTGTTGKAGVCISATATRDGTSLIAVVLGSNSSKERFTAATTLLDYGFANYERADFPAVEGLPSTAHVSGGSVTEVGVTCPLPESLLVKKGERAGLRAEVTLQEGLTAPLAAGQEVGKVSLYHNDALMAEYPIVTMEAVEKMSFSLGMDILKESLFRL